MEYGKTTKERQSSVLGNMRDMFGKYICSSYDDDYGVFFSTALPIILEAVALSQKHTR